MKPSAESIDCTLFTVASKLAQAKKHGTNLWQLQDRTSVWCVYIANASEVSGGKHVPNLAGVGPRVRPQTKQETKRMTRDRKRSRLWTSLCGMPSSSICRSVALPVLLFCRHCQCILLCPVPYPVPCPALPEMCLHSSAQGSAVLTACVGMTFHAYCHPPASTTLATAQQPVVARLDHTAGTCCTTC